MELLSRVYHLDIPGTSPFPPIPLVIQRQKKYDLCFQSS